MIVTYNFDLPEDNKELEIFGQAQKIYSCLLEIFYNIKDEPHLDSENLDIVYKLGYKDAIKHIKSYIAEQNFIL